MCPSLNKKGASRRSQAMFMLIAYTVGNLRHFWSNLVCIACSELWLIKVWIAKQILITCYKNYLTRNIYKVWGTCFYLICCNKSTLLTENILKILILTLFSKNATLSPNISSYILVLHDTKSLSFSIKHWARIFLKLSISVRRYFQPSRTLKCLTT